ncbi:MAG TPA: NUDIX hydrolase [Thermomicrobiales bacterium]|jgi:ADP-ribose pyrophosphatase|nr:NUDIX hydrolase [Thermomicrobiales bacterium]
MPQVIDSYEDAPDLPHDEHLSSEMVFEGTLLKVRVDKVRTPSGKEAQRELVEHPGSAAIVPVTTDGKVLFVRQFRYSTGEYLLELPAGLIDEGEDPEETARRELIEETGYKAGTIRELCKVYISPGYTKEVTAIYLAEDCVEIESEDDEDEPIQLFPVPLTDIQKMLTPGGADAVDAQTMLGMLWLVRLGLA